MSTDESATQTGAPGPIRRSTDGGRFVAGTLLAGRYRIVTLLGRGGMGEVYKADDLKLDQSVALKFLPAAIGMQSQALARFHNEARIARQVSHPNVCRVYDIGEIDGLHFLTMEFIDGEDLASLLRRIGRLPSDKAVQISRQLCAGLAAAHDLGVLHRDLKPANVMIDSRGRARITDFGLAALAHDMRSADVLAGTPAYMAPEQIQGHDPTPRSDIYALGLVLYEIFTGKRAVDASSLADALLYHASGEAVTTPSHWVPDLEPLVERAILRCLEKDPSNRPATPILVAATLPGGNPLQAALAAGETPSPEMVAAAGSREAISVRIGATLLLTIFVMIVGAAWMRTQVNVAARVPFDIPPEVLAHKAREMIAGFGYRDPPADTAYGLMYDVPFLRYDARGGDQASRWRQLEVGRPPAILFWYRESPTPLVVTVRGGPSGPPRVGPVAEDNPPLVAPGMRLAHLDTRGRLIRFRAVSREFAEAAVDAKPIDWPAVFTAAALDHRAFALAEQRWTPPVATDTRAAWTGVYPERSDLALRIEGGGLRGVLTAFETMGPWHPGMQPAQATSGRSRIGLIAGVLISTLVFLGAVLAWRNVQSGRGDRRGALRLALLLFSLRFLVWVLNTDHVPGLLEVQLFRLGLSDAVLDGVSGYVLYLALEPYIRRRWPQVLIAWNRALAGRAHDALLGYEILVGVALAAVAALVGLTTVIASSGMTATTDLNSMLSVRRVAASLVDEVAGAIFVAVATAFLMFLLRELLRREWLAGVVVVLMFSATGIGGGTFGPTWWPVVVQGAAFGIGVAVALTRFGLTALVTFFFMYAFLRNGPSFLQTSAWYSGVSMFVFAAVLTITAWALHVAIGGPLSRTAASRI